MRAISSAVFGTFSGFQSVSSSSAAIAFSCTIIACRFSLERPRRTGLFSPPARLTTSRPIPMLLAEPRLLSRRLSRGAPTPPPLAGSAVPSSSDQSRKAMIMVMSSVRTSYCSHSRYDSATTARHASSGSSNLSTMSVTLWLVRNSQTPSEATMMKLSSRVISLTSSSGSAVTPMPSATWSPMLRVKAQPGKLLPGAHTRGGSPPLSSSSPRLTPQFSWKGTMPSSWSQLITTAPAAFTRSRSSARYGVWSMESE
mmetsp:Transcript_27141/g.64618  ORF Transcript_27141/g.64618 Transcript_27141/m.64618 type:complete len:255 (+) Transcript_27141:1864-2628(+)